MGRHGPAMLTVDYDKGPPPIMIRCSNGKTVILLITAKQQGKGPKNGGSGRAGMDLVRVNTGTLTRE